MEDPFRFVGVRAAQAPDAQSVSFQGKTPFQDFVRPGLNPDSSAEYKWEYMRSSANEYTSGINGDQKAIQKIEYLAYHAKYADLRSVLASSTSERDLAFVEAAIEKVFAKPAYELQSDNLYNLDRAWVWDSILLIFLVPRLQGCPFKVLIEIAQIMGIIRRVAERDASLDQPTAVDDALSAMVILPPHLLPPHGT